MKRLLNSEARQKCESCGIVRTKSQLQYMNHPCECINPQFKKMQIKTNRKNRIQKINKMLEDKFFRMMNKINELQKEVKQGRRKKKQLFNKKPNPFDQFCRGLGLQKISHTQLVRSNNIERRLALDMYGRKPRINFKEELLLLREKRK